MTARCATLSPVRSLEAVAVVLTAAFAALAACGGGGSGGSRAAPPTATVAPEVVERVETFVDTSRPTAAPLEAPDRTLVTTIRHPSTGGPSPLVVLAHGFDGHPRKFERLTEAWAAAGYVVAAPAFPLTNDEAPERVLGDVAEQPADVSFVIDEMLRLNGEAGDPLEGLIDPERIGVAGLSFGAITTLAVTYNTCCRDERIGAAVSMAGTQYPFDGAFAFSGVPLLLLHGDADPVLASDLSAEIYDVAAPAKLFVTILGGGHAEPFEDVDDPADAMVQAATTAFWDLYLGSPGAAADDLIAAATVSGLTTVQHDAG